MGSRGRLERRVGKHSKVREFESKYNVFLSPRALSCRVRSCRNSIVRGFESAREFESSEYQSLPSITCLT